MNGAKGPGVFSAACFLVSAAELSQLPADGMPEVAFSGRSNAGKSSALNALCAQRQLARVSRTPGRTQLLNFFDLPGGRLVDLPGYGYAEVAREQQRDWGRVLTGYIEHRPMLRGIVLVSDIRHALVDFDRQLLAWTARVGRPMHVLLTKADKLSRSQAMARLKEVERALPNLHPGAKAQLFSATAGTGVEEARKAVLDWLTQEPDSGAGGAGTPE
ncbi:MAG TPA: ribosome biogenesis GTP-binding protein YihA/YsxC [Candidatus Binatia bacterium]|nr:ribosome biogenesis GTP-binding protein YihA/YsxC [Candidatus Binatia bacterium]